MTFKITSDLFETLPALPNIRDHFPPQSRGIRGGLAAFTLIELLLGVTLSAILMMGIVVFVSGSLGSNIAMKKIIEQGNKNEYFEQRLTETIGNIAENGIYATGSNFGVEYLSGIFLATL